MDDTSDSRPAAACGSAVDWVFAVQQMLDAIPGNHAVMLPVRDSADDVRDLRIVAASSGAVDAYGRTGREMVGAGLRGDYGEAVHGCVWEAFRDAFLKGVPRTVPVPFPRTGEEAPVQMVARLHPVGAGLLFSWSRQDDLVHPEERIARTERLANLGFAVRDQLTGTTVWSDQLYRITERDPALGPMSDDELDAVTVLADLPIRRTHRRALVSGRPVDVTYRILVGGVEKHVRVVAEPVSDVHGRPLREVAIVQDITARVTSGRKLALAERQVSEHRKSLAAESRLATELQQIILPIPSAPIDLPGLRVGVRYLPAERASRIGGDWFYASTAYDGSVIVAVGDVAGHGMQAAAAMAQQRHALATLTGAATSEPAELLHYLNRLTYADEEPTGIASAVVARYEPATGTLEWAQAGHPAPLRTRGGATTELARPAGMMLGVALEPVYETASVTVRPGDLLLFYTDGLVERRGQSPEDGLRPVIATLDRLSSQGSRAPLADLLAQLHQANPDDDTCILAIRHRAERAPDRPGAGSSTAQAGMPA